MITLYKARPVATTKELVVGGVYKFVVNAELLKDGNTVSSMAWSIDDSVVSLGTPSLSTDESTCLVTAANEGDTQIKLTTTLSDTQKYIHYIQLTVTE